MNEYVIIGNGVAAVGCIEGIRSVDTESPITVISRENHPVYGRPLISYYLEGKTTLEKMNYRNDNFYSQNGCRVIYGKSAAAIGENKLELDDGSALPFTHICIATGSSPFIPPIAGFESVQNKFTFMTLDDTLALEAAITAESKVLIVGAGLIGLKCAEGLSKRVKSITVCDVSSRVLSSVLDDKCAALMQKRLEENGICFMLGDTAVKFNGNTAVMKSGRSVDFDVLVMAVGVRPNVTLAKDCGCEVNKGILVDDTMKTNLRNIYAAGDCTEGMDISLDARRVLAILPNAYMQGHTAGVNMAGGSEKFDNAIPMNSVGFFGLHAIAAGSYFEPSDGGEVYEETGNGEIKRLYTKNGFLTGYILIGNVERSGIYTSLIREKIPLDSLNFDILKKTPTLFAFSQNFRRKKLGGVV